MSGANMDFKPLNKMIINTLIFFALSKIPTHSHFYKQLSNQNPAWEI